MSAYICHEDTINLIASAAARYDVTCYTRPEMVRIPDEAAKSECLRGRANAEAMARCLYAENVYSVNYRYRETNTGDWHTFRSIDLDGLCCTPHHPALVVLASIRCLRYQSCEGPDYAQSFAAALLDSIEAACIRKLTSDLPWGWTREWTNERRDAVRTKIAMEMGLH